MHPAFASLHKELKALEASIGKQIEPYRYEEAPDDDPDSIVDGIRDSIGSFLLGLEHQQERLPNRTEADWNAHDDLNRSVKALIRRTRDELIEIGGVEEYLEDWFKGYLASGSDE